MTDKKVSLALSFIAEEPEAAAKILEQSKVHEVAEFLENLPLDYQYQVIEQLLPSFAARLCFHIGWERSAAILTDLETEKLAKILRLLPKSEAAQVLDELPKKKREACRLLLKYSVRVIGAWMHAGPVAVSNEMSVDEAIHYLQDETEPRVTGYLYVIDREAKLQGQISFIKLLKARGNLIIKDIMERNAPHLSVHMLVENAQSLDLWNESNTLAVVDKDSRLQGSIHYSDVRKALNQSKDQSYTQSHAPDVVSGITGVYGKTLLVLLNNLMNVIEPDLKS